MYYYQTDRVTTPNGAEIEPVTMEMVKEDLNLEESYDANKIKLSLLIKRARSEVETSIHNHIAVVGMRTEVCSATPVISLPGPIIRIQ